MGAGRRRRRRRGKSLRMTEDDDGILGALPPRRSFSRRGTSFVDTGGYDARVCQPRAPSAARRRTRWEVGAADTSRSIILRSIGPMHRFCPCFRPRPNLQPRSAEESEPTHRARCERDGDGK